MKFIYLNFKLVMRLKTGFMKRVMRNIIMAALLVSPIRMFSFKLKSLTWSANKSQYIFLALALVALLTLGIYSVPTIIVIYVVISTVGWLFCKR